MVDFRHMDRCMFQAIPSIIRKKQGINKINADEGKLKQHDNLFGCFWIGGYLGEFLMKEKR